MMRNRCDFWWCRATSRQNRVNEVCSTQGRALRHDFCIILRAATPGNFEFPGVPGLSETMDPAGEGFCKIRLGQDSAVKGKVGPGKHVRVEATSKSGFFRDHGNSVCPQDTGLSSLCQL